MKIFISHSSMDGTIAKTLSAFLESVDYSIEVFCSSQIGNIRVGRDFVNVITDELQSCDAFIPILSKNYYKSRFCMVELGFAYSILFHRSANENDYIFPLSVPPVKKNEALVDTPLARLQVGCVNDMEDIKSYIEAIFENRNVPLGAGLNKRIHAFVYDINKVLFESFDIFANARILLCKSSNVFGEDRDYLNCSLISDDNGYSINFRAKPFESSKEYPDFLSVVFKYVDQVDLYEVSNIYSNACMSVHINNYTNSIMRIVVELKYSDSNNILERRSFELAEGDNEIKINLRELRSEALKRISEICFVVPASSYIEDEGMFQIKQLKIIQE